MAVVDSDVARLRRGDVDALSELISRYQNRLYRYSAEVGPATGGSRGPFPANVGTRGGKDSLLRSKQEF